MTIIPNTNTHEAASKGDTGPRDRVSAKKFATNPATMAISPFPKNTAFEKVKDNHCASNPLYKMKYKRKKIYHSQRIYIFSM